MQLVTTSFRLGVTSELKETQQRCLHHENAYLFPLTLLLFQLGVSLSCRPLNNYSICSTVATGNRPEIILPGFDATLVP